ncbi:MAG TPA: hypothetical protein VF896_12315 [Anaerolineales bacterium]
MNKTKRHILFLILVITLLAIPTFVVFAKELGMLTISGPGIKGELTLNDPKAMLKLEQSGFFDQAALIKPPQNLGEGYTITAHLNLDGKVVPFVQMVYYPTAKGEPSYVHYIGRLNGETLQKVDEWSTLSLDADTAFRGLMDANNITLQSAIVSAPPAAAPAVAPVTAPAVSSVPIPTSYIILALVAVALLLAGAGLVLRRRTISHTTT